MKRTLFTILALAALASQISSAAAADNTELLIARAPSAAMSEEAPITIGATSTLIYDNADSRARKVLVRNTSAVSVFVCTCTVTTSTGFLISAGDAATFVTSAGEQLNGVVASGTQTVYRSVGLF